MTATGTFKLRAAYKVIRKRGVGERKVRRVAAGIAAASSDGASALRSGVAQTRKLEAQRGFRALVSNA